MTAQKTKNNSKSQNNILLWTIPNLISVFCSQKTSSTLSGSTCKTIFLFPQSFFWQSLKLANLLSKSKQTTYINLKGGWPQTASEATEVNAIKAYNQQTRKSQKKSHSTLRAKRATFTFWVAKSSLKMPKMLNLASFWKPEACSQPVLPDRSILIGQKLVKKAKIQKFNCDILS